MKLKVGDRVRIKVSHYSVPNLTGRLGTIDHIYENPMYERKVAVLVDGVENRASAKGYFYFNKRELEKVTEGEDYMNTTKHMDGDFRVALVRFEFDGTNADKTYKYACYDNDIKVEDICVVKSANHGFGLARIVDFEPKTDEPITREIVCVTDFTAFYLREATRAQREKLMTKMAERAEQLKEISLYETLAKADPEMAEMLNIYKQLVI